MRIIIYDFIIFKKLSEEMFSCVPVIGDTINIRRNLYKVAKRLFISGKNEVEVYVIPIEEN